MIILRCHQDVGEAATDHWWEEKRNVSEVWFQQINTQICSFYPRPMCFQGSDPSKLWLSHISSILRPRPHPVGAVQYAGQRQTQVAVIQLVMVMEFLIIICQRQTQVHQVLKRWWNLTQGCLPQLQGWLLQLEASQRTSFCCWLWSPGSYFNEKKKIFFFMNHFLLFSPPMSPQNLAATKSPNQSRFDHFFFTFHQKYFLWTSFTPEVLQWWLHPFKQFSSKQLWELLPRHGGQWIQVQCEIYMHFTSLLWKHLEC